MGHEAEALLSIGLLVVVAKVAEGVFRRFGLSSIIAYAATCVAVLLSGKVSVPPGSTVACIISGGNVGVRELRGLLSQVE